MRTRSAETTFELADVRFRMIIAAMLVVSVVVAVLVVSVVVAVDHAGRGCRAGRSTGGCAHTVPAEMAVPVLRAAASRLTWTAIPGVSSYEVATVRDQGSASRITYQVVTGTSFSPPAVAGERIRYGVRANASGSHWSRRVAIQWPPAVQRTVRPQKLRVAVNNTTGWNVDMLFREIGVTWERLDIGRGDDLSLLRLALSHGMHVLPAFASGDTGNLDDLTPAQVSSSIASLAPRLNALGISELEFGNEVYNSISAREYAALYNAAHVAAAGRLRLISVATTDYYSKRTGGSGNWFLDMKNALPGGASEVDGWSIHPYGSLAGLCHDGYGWPMLGPLHTESVEAGFSPTLPWYITEVGQQIAGGGHECEGPVTQDQQAADYVHYLNDVISSYPWIVFLSFYASRDDSSGAFGLLNTDNSARPSFTTLATWMAEHTASVDG